jgi:hypothetical protein
MNKKLLVTLTAVIALALPGFAAKTEKEGKRDKAGGIVKAVNVESRTLTVARSKGDSGGKEKTLKVAKEVDLSKVKVGDAVQLKLSDSDVVEGITPHEKKKKDQ